MKRPSLFSFSLVLGGSLGASYWMEMHHREAKQREFQKAVILAVHHVSSYGILLTADPKQLESTDIAVRDLVCLAGAQTGYAPIQSEMAEPEFAKFADQVREKLPHVQRHNDPRLPEEINRIIDLIVAIHYVADDRKAKRIEDTRDEYYPGSKTPQMVCMEDLLLEGQFTAENYPGVSRPVLYVSVARRLGYPLFLVATRGHLFVRYVDSKGKDWNLEREPAPQIQLPPNSDPLLRAITANMNTNWVVTHDDAYYRKWPTAVSEKEIQENGWMKSLTPAEETALFLEVQGMILMQKNQGYYSQIAYAGSLRFDPHNQRSQIGLTRCMDIQLQLSHLSWAQLERDNKEELSHFKKPTVNEGDHFEIELK